MSKRKSTRSRKAGRSNLDDPSIEHRQARLRLLGSELGSMRASAFERTRSLDTKASFVVVAAGIVASATGLGLIRAETYFTGIVPFGFTIATVIVSTISLWPRGLRTPEARSVVSEWLESELTDEQLEDTLLELKTREIELRDEQNENKAKWAKRGFVMLLISLSTAFVIATANALVESLEVPDGPETCAIAETVTAETCD